MKTLTKLFVGFEPPTNLLSSTLILPPLTTAYFQGKTFLGIRSEKESHQLNLNDINNLFTMTEQLILSLYKRNNINPSEQSIPLLMFPETLIS